jgi:hypothetical protein
MKKKNFLHFTFKNIWILLFIFFLTSCSFGLPSSEKTLSVGYCVDILGTENESYHHPIVQCLINLEKKGELQLQLRRSNKKEDYKQHIQALAQNNAVVFCSPLMKEECIECSFQYPETQFVLLDTYPFQMEKMVLPDRENLTFLFFSDEEIATIAGFIAAHISDTESAALYFPGSQNSPLKNRLYNHYVEGFRLASPGSENIIFCFTQEDFESGKMSQEIENTSVGSIFYFPGLYYASLVDETAPLAKEIAFPYWSLFLLGGEQGYHDHFAGVIRKNYPSVIEYVLGQYKKQMGELDSVIVCTRKENAFLFNPGDFPFSDESLQRINEFLMQPK